MNIIEINHQKEAPKRHVAYGDETVEGAVKKYRERFGCEPTTVYRHERRFSWKGGKPSYIYIYIPLPEKDDEDELADRRDGNAA